MTAFIIQNRFRLCKTGRVILIIVLLSVFCCLSCHSDSDPQEIKVKNRSKNESAAQNTAEVPEKPVKTAQKVVDQGFKRLVADIAKELNLNIIAVSSAGKKINFNSAIENKLEIYHETIATAELYLLQNFNTVLIGSREEIESIKDNPAARGWGVTTRLQREIPPKIHSGRLISLDLQDQDFDNALRILAQVSNFNILASPRMNKKINAKLIDVPWDLALDVFLLLTNSNMLCSGNAILINSIDEIERISNKSDYRHWEMKRGSECRKEASAGAAHHYRGRTISVDLVDTDISNFARIISEVSKIPIEVTPGVNKKVTARLIDLPWDQVLEIILLINNLKTIKAPDGLMIDQSAPD